MIHTDEYRASLQHFINSCEAVDEVDSRCAYPLASVSVSEWRQRKFNKLNSLSPFAIRANEAKRETFIFISRVACKAIRLKLEEPSETEQTKRKLREIKSKLTRACVCVCEFILQYFLVCFVSIHEFRAENNASDR